MCVGFYLYIYPQDLGLYILQVQSGKQFEKCYIIPGREIPKWFYKVNICDTSVVSHSHLGPGKTCKIKKVKIQLPGSGCDGWRGIVLCVVILPTVRHHGRIALEVGFVTSFYTSVAFTSEYGKAESHHLWLLSVSKNEFDLIETPGRSIDSNGFHQVELEIEADCFEVEKVGFCVV